METAFSAGFAIRDLLKSAPQVAAITERVFPGTAEKAALPYISYRRRGMSVTPVKGPGGPMCAQIELTCYTSGYDEGVRLAEAVYETMQGRSMLTAGGLAVRGICLEDSYEDEDGEAKMQVLVFNIRI